VSDTPCLLSTGAQPAKVERKAEATAREVNFMVDECDEKE
jgi:hypothetical protein